MIRYQPNDRERERNGVAQPYSYYTHTHKVIAQLLLGWWLFSTEI